MFAMRSDILLLLSSTWLTISGTTVLNPTTEEGMQACNMNETSTLCDRDAVFEADERESIAQELRELSNYSGGLTYKKDTSQECFNSTVKASLYAVASAQKQELEDIRDAIAESWGSNECNNTLVFVYSASNFLYAISRPVYGLVENAHALHVQHFLRQEADNLDRTQVSKAFVRIIQKIKDRFRKTPLWTTNTFPNPRNDEFAKCNMNESSTICDPDKVLNDVERNRGDVSLELFEWLTSSFNDPKEALSSKEDSFCAKRGISFGILVMRRIQGGTMEDILGLAKYAKDSWRLDTACHKSIIFALAVDDDVYAAVADKGTTFSEEDMQIWVNEQRKAFVSYDIEKALAGISRNLLVSYVPDYKQLLSSTISPKSPSHPKESASRSRTEVTENASDTNILMKAVM